MWIIKLIVHCLLGFIFVFGALILIFPCFLTWRWSVPYKEFLKFLDNLYEKFFEFENDKTVD